MNVTAPTAAPPASRKPLYKSLFFQILVAVVAGILIGHLWPDIGAALRPLGDGFIQLIKMIIAPLIFLVIVTGIAAVSDVKAVGRTGRPALRSGPPRRLQDDSLYDTSNKTLMAGRSLLRG